MLKKVLLGLSIVCGAFMLFFLDGLIGQPARSKEKYIKPESKDSYNEYGLPNGVELSEELIFSNDEVVCYTDRIFKHFVADGDSPGDIAKACDNISAGIQGIDHFIIIPVPSRIMYEDGFEEDKEEYEQFVSGLKSSILKEWMMLDVKECFDTHPDENLYYRTHDSITLLGGLYSANALVDSLGGEPLSRDKFQTFQYNSEYGSLYVNWMRSSDLTATQRERMSEMAPDPIYSYAINGRTFNEVLYKSETDSYERPAILMSSVAGGEAIGSGFLRAVIDGEGRSFPGSIAFIVGDSSADKIAPYLAYYYDTVCVIAINGEDDIRSTVSKLRMDYETADFIWAQNAGKMGERAYSKVLNSFREE